MYKKSIKHLTIAIHRIINETLLLWSDYYSFLYFRYNFNSFHNLSISSKKAAHQNYIESIYRNSCNFWFPQRLFSSNLGINNLWARNLLKTSIQSLSGAHNGSYWTVTISHIYENGSCSFLSLNFFIVFAQKRWKVFYWFNWLQNSINDDQSSVREIYSKFFKFSNKHIFFCKILLNCQIIYAKFRNGIKPTNHFNVRKLMEEK